MSCVEVHMRVGKLVQWERKCDKCFMFHLWYLIEQVLRTTAGIAGGRSSVRGEPDLSVSSAFCPCRKWRSTRTSWVELSTWKWMRLLASTWPEFLLRWGNSMKLWLRRTARMLRPGSSLRYGHTNEQHSNALPQYSRLAGPYLPFSKWLIFYASVCDFTVVFPFRLKNWTVKLPPTPSRYRPASRRSRNCAAPCRAWRSSSSRSSAWYGAAPSTPPGAASHCPLPPLLSHLSSTPPPWDKLHSNLTLLLFRKLGWKPTCGTRKADTARSWLRSRSSSPAWRSSWASSAVTWSARTRSTKCSWTSRAAWSRRSPPTASCWRARTPSMSLCASPDEQIRVTHSGEWELWLPGWLRTAQSRSLHTQPLECWQSRCPANPQRCHNSSQICTSMVGRIWKYKSHHFDHDELQKVPGTIYMSHLIPWLHWN